MNVQKITVKKVSDSVVEQIEKLIKEGTFQSGEKLPSVREMCEMFGVGRSAIRDAIITLKGKGTVDVRQGEGTYIRRFDSSKMFSNHLISPENNDIKELDQVRKLLEPGIAKMAALYRTEKHLKEMEKLISRKCAEGWEDDYLFHMTIAQASGNQIIFQLMQFISTTTKKHMNDFHQYTQQNQPTLNEISKQHEDIFFAIKSMNGDLAEVKMTEHLEYVESIFLSKL